MQVISVGHERYRACESLFQPSLLPNEPVVSALHTATFDSIMKCDANLHKALFSNIVLVSAEVSHLEHIASC